ncbi:hypothetical protein RND81_02G061500 [Saponaria officinalis]|uniref:Dehydrin n=1 Tax=Saponaria officinalis TaxID=3572 RepID=A0AAW1MUB0_SAPOF
MADNLNEQAPATVETSDRGWFDFMKTKKEEEKPQEDTLVSEFDHKAQVSEPDFKKEEFEDEKNKHVGLLEKLHRSDSSSSSSSDEEGNDEEKKQRRKEKNEKKGLKQKLDEKLHGHKAEDDTNVPIEKYEETEKLPHVQPAVYAESPLVQESDHKKAGFLDKVEDKLPGGHNKAYEHHVSADPVETEKLPHVQKSDHEKKAGFLDKVEDKLPGGHNKANEHHVSAAPVETERQPHVQKSDHEKKAGFLDKVGDKLPGGHNKAGEHHVSASPVETEKLPHVQEAVYSEPPLVQKSDHEKKAGFLDKVKDKLPSSHNKADEHHVSAAPVETEKLPHVQEAVYSEPPLDHEKKAGFLDKVKDKLPGGHNKADEHHVSADTSLEAEGKDKKGFLDKIKDKIPGLHSKTPEEKKEHEEKKKGF